MFFLGLMLSERSRVKKGAYLEDIEGSWLAGKKEGSSCIKSVSWFDVMDDIIWLKIWLNVSFWEWEG